MKPIKKHLGGLFFIGALVALAGFIQAQVDTASVEFDSGSATLPDAMTDSVVRMAAEAQGLSLAPPDQIPPDRCGTFWIVTSEQYPAPWPFLPAQFDPTSTPIYSLGAAGGFLVDGTGGIAPQPTGQEALLGITAAILLQEQGNMVLDFISQILAAQANAALAQAQVQTMETDDSGPPVPGDGGDGGETNGVFGSGYSIADYGTNLWIRVDGIASNNLTGILSNSVADVPMELQTNSDLVSTNWVSAGFVYGSELTNWTAWSLPMSSLSNLFVRIRSWADDGSGLPIWWQRMYFGVTGADPYGNPSGDGWNNLYKFQHGMDPNVFYTPPAPQGLTVAYNASDNTAVVSWQPSSGSVAGYSVKRDNNGTITTFDFSVGTTSFTDTTQPQTPDLSNWWVGPVSYNPTYRVQALYTGGRLSAWSTPENLLSSQNSVTVRVVHGSQNSQNLVMSRIPQNMPSIHITRMGPWDQSGQPQGDTTATTFDIPFATLVNGAYPLSESDANPPDGDFYTWWAQTIPTNGGPSAAAGPAMTYVGTTLFYDGRVQLKQDLIFQLRAATMFYPFGYYIGSDSYNLFDFIYPADYAFSGFYQTFDQYGNRLDTLGTFDGFLPFENNYFYRNFVFNLSDVNQGFPTTGIWGIDSPFVILSNSVVAYQFQAPATNGASIPALLGTNDARWLGAGAYLGGSPLHLNEIGASLDGSGVYHLASNASNYLGLPFLSAKIAYPSGGGTATTTLDTGGNTTQGGYFYAETAQPRFQTVEYDFWKPADGNLPGMPSFSPTNTTTPLFIAGVGQSMPRIVGYAKLAITNGYPGVFGYLGQYFDRANTEGANGVATTNSAGVLSPYGDFFPTYPGPAALVTMPDIDTGARGTCTVSCVSIALDKNHDSTMDLSWNGPDATSQASPMVAWINNGLTIPGAGGNLDHDVPVFTNTPPNSSYGQIRCQRNLENFFRLWVCGTPALSYSQNNYLVNLTWRNVSSGSPSINIYRACETNGGTGYLTDLGIAGVQVTNATYGTSLYGGAVTNGSTFWFPLEEFATAGDHHYLFEGAGVGSGELVLTITQDGNTIAQASAWLDLRDVKDLFELSRPSDVALADPPTTNTGAFTIDSYETAEDASEEKQIIVFVHGLNNTEFVYEDCSRTVFKRLYWQGYHGRYTSFRWPSPTWSLMPTSTNQIGYLNFNKGEYIGFQSGAALRRYIDDFRGRFPGYTVNVFATSAGGAVVNEAIRLGAQVDNYVMAHVTLPAEAFDGNNTNLIYSYLAMGGLSTPDADSLGGYNNCFTNATRRVNFYNDDDYACFTGPLGAWEGTQKATRPDHSFGVPGWDYYFDGTNCFYEITDENGLPISTRMLTQDYEKKSYVARSRTKAVGAAGLKYAPFALTRGAITNNISLQDASLGFVGAAAFGATRAEHSGEYKKSIQNSVPFYRELLKDGFLIIQNP